MFDANSLAQKLGDSEALSHLDHIQGKGYYREWVSTAGKRCLERMGEVSTLTTTYEVAVGIHTYPSTMYILKRKAKKRKENV